MTLCVAHLVVLATGFAVLAVEVVVGGAAITLNLLGLGVVVARQRGGSEHLSRRTRLVFATAIVGMPLGLGRM